MSSFDTNCWAVILSYLFIHLDNEWDKDTQTIDNSREKNVPHKLIYTLFLQSSIANYLEDLLDLSDLPRCSWLKPFRVFQTDKGCHSEWHQGH